MVTDNAANIVAATRIIAWKHVPCFAHTLNLIVKEAPKADPAFVSIQKSDIVTFFHRSAKASDKLDEVQKQLKLPHHKLIQDVETRWNSTFYMFQCILQQHEAITTALRLLGRNTICLSCEDVESIKEAVSILDPFEIAITELNADKYVSISKLIPMARSLQHVTGVSDTSTSVMHLKEELVAQMCHRFTNIEGNPLLAVSTLLDPRLKKLAF